MYSLNIKVTSGHHNSMMMMLFAACNWQIALQFYGAFAITFANASLFRCANCSEMYTDTICLMTFDDRQYFRGRKKAIP